MLSPTSLLRSKRWPLVALSALLVVGAFTLSPYLIGERVQVLSAAQGEMRQSIVASGRVRTPSRVELSSQITGRVVAIEAQEGARISAGQALVHLDNGEWKASVGQAKAALLQAEARLRQLNDLSLPVAQQTLRQAEVNFEQARRHHNRVSELVARGFYSATQLDDARRSLDVAESQQRAALLQVQSHQNGGGDARLAATAVDQAKAGLAVAEARLAYGTIAAPISGTVLTRSVEPGDTVQPGKILMALAPAGDTELTVHIDEKNLHLLRLGQRALASADAYPGERFQAEIAFIAPAVDPQRGSVEVRLKVPEPPAFLKHEMTVSVDIEAARRSDTVIVSLEGIREVAGRQPWALVVRDGIATRQNVRLGLRGDGKVEVLEGLSPGDAVVPAGRPVAEGRRVRAVTG